MLGRCHIAKHRGTVPSRESRADGRRDVIVARRDVGGQRPEHVEGRLEAGVALLLHVHLDLIHRDVSRPLDHHLHVVRPGPLGERTEDFQLGELRLIRRIGEAAWTQ